MTASVTASATAPAPASAAPPAFLRYDPGIESVPPGEAETARALVDTLCGIGRATDRPGAPTLRSVHAKSHGLLAGELEVLPGLAAPYAQGLCAAPGRYPVVLRLSTTPGDLLDDGVSTPRGLALKVIGVPGERLEGPEAPGPEDSGSEAAGTQNFVLISGPVAPVPDPGTFLRTLRLFALTTDRIEGVKRALSTALRGVQAAVVAATGGPSAALVAFGGQPATHILGESFFSQVAIRWGDHVAKVAVVPVSPELTALTNRPLPADGGPNALRASVLTHFRDRGGVWELRAQLCTELAAMPVEDPAAVWPEAASPYVAVARITVPPQCAWSPARAAAVDEGMAFDPWHGLAAHRPLGTIMRVRRTVYAALRASRAERSGRAIEEPRAAPDLPD